MPLTPSSFLTHCPLANTHLNYLWSSIIVETLAKLGIKQIIICPGSRSAPLSLVCANHPNIECISVLDERSAAFLALGMSRYSQLPTAVICTSGTAGAHFYPAIIEGFMSNTPLLIITTDRPNTLRYCHSRQTINQYALFGNFVRFFCEITDPILDFSKFEYLREMIGYSYQQSLRPIPGPVHINIPFSEPLEPITDKTTEDFLSRFNWDDFFQYTQPSFLESIPNHHTQNIPDDFSKTKGIILVGYSHSKNSDSFCNTLQTLSNKLNWPILAEKTSPIHHTPLSIPNLIHHYDLILRNPSLCQQLQPEVILTLESTKISKSLSNWLETLNIPFYHLDTYSQNKNYQHKKAIRLHTTLDAFTHNLPHYTKKETTYLNTWSLLNQQASTLIEESMSTCDTIFEGKIPWILAHHLPEKTTILSSVSMPLRDIEYFWHPSKKNFRFYYNTGCFGIDGTISSALGTASQNENSLLITGDLAFLHDSQGLLMHNQFKGPLTILVINNNGGGIFHNLPLAQYTQHQTAFHRFIVTPQSVCIKTLAQAYSIPYFNPKNWSDLSSLIQNKPTESIRIIEIITKPSHDIPFRKQILSSIAQKLSTH